MAYPNVMEDVRACVRLGTPGRVPIFAISELFDIRMAGITHQEFTWDVDKLVRCEMEAIERFDYDWVYLNPDDNIEFEPLGVKTRGEGNVPLGACEFLPATRDTLRKLKVPDFQKDGRMPAFLEAIRRLKAEFGGRVCLTGRVAAPFTSVALLYGVENTMAILVEDPDLLRKTGEFFLHLMSEWGEAQVRAGADAIWVGDCVAGSGFISAKQYAEHALPGAAALNQALRDAGGVVFYHVGENSLAHLERMADTRPDVLSVGGRIDLRKAKETVGRRVCLMGNIPGIEVLLNGDAEEVRRQTIRIMQAGRKNGGYIFNSEEAIPYQTPEANVKVMMETARSLSRYEGGNGA